MFGKKEGHDSRAVANYFVKKSHAEGRLLGVSQTVKLVYLAHGWHLGLTGKPLICHEVEAWKYGPVIPLVYDAFRDQLGAVRHLALEDGHPYEADFDEYAKRIMDRVYNAYSKIGIVALSNLTHEKGTPWSWASREGGRYSLISNRLIEEYYKRLIVQKRERDKAQGLSDE